MLPGHRLVILSLNAATPPTWSNLSAVKMCLLARGAVYSRISRGIHNSSHNQPTQLQHLKRWHIEADYRAAVGNESDFHPVVNVDPASGLGPTIRSSGQIFSTNLNIFKPGFERGSVAFDGRENALCRGVTFTEFYIIKFRFGSG